jgi:hypothetical protein
MKKVLILTLIVMILVGCSSNDGAQANSSTETVIASDTEPTSATEIVSTEITEVESSEVTNDKDTAEEEIILSPSFPHPIDAVTFGLTKSYYNEAGGIVVEGYLVNTSEYTAEQIRLAKLELFNEDDELLASNSFGYMPYGTRLKSGNAMEYTCIFPAITVFIQDDDLDTVKPVSKFR